MVQKKPTCSCSLKCLAILHYRVILTCPWFSESTEIKDCIPACAANNSFCNTSFGSYICECPYGFNPLLGHKGVLLHCEGMTKLHVLVFRCHLKKKIETFLTFTLIWSQIGIPLRLLFKKKRILARGRQSLWHKGWERCVYLLSTS